MSATKTEALLLAALVGSVLGCPRSWADPPKPKVVLPSQIIGDWQNGSASAVSYYNPATGTFAPPSGSGMSYSIRADGTFTYSGILQTTLYHCTKTSSFYCEGTATATAGSVTFTDRINLYQWKDTCGASDPKPKNKPPETNTFPWRIEPGADAAHPVRVLTDKTGELRFHKK